MMVWFVMAWLLVGYVNRMMLLKASHRDWGRDIYGWFGWAVVAAGPVGIVGALWAW